MKRSILALLIICLFQIVPDATLAQTPNNKVTVYSDDYAGNKVELGPGKYDHMHLVRDGIMTPKSLKVPQGMRAILYERDNFEGGSVTLTDNIKKSQLEAKGFANLSQNVSVIIEKIPAAEMPAPGTWVTIYRDDFSGTTKNLVPGHYDFHDLGDVENDQLSSIKIPEGMKVILYEHGGFQGRSASFTTDTRAGTLKTSKFNDITSSIIVEKAIVVPKPPEQEPVVVVVVPAVTETTQQPNVETVNPVVQEPTEPIIYQGDFSGPSKSLPAGRYSSDRLGIANDELSSIKVPKGFRVTLYDGDAFEGKSLVVTGDARAAFFADNHFNNMTSSVLVEVLPMITVYEGDYGGVAARLLAGRYQGHDFGIGNDQLSSVRVPRGLSVTLFEDERFGGRSLTLTQDSGTDVLTAQSFNNETSSIVVEVVTPIEPVVTAPAVIIYADKFSGKSQSLPPGRYALKDIMIGENQVSSATVPKGLRLVLYEDDGFKGYSLTADGNIDLAVSKVFDNRTSSLIVEDAAVTKTEEVPTKEETVITPVVVTPPAPPQQPAPCEMSTTQFQSAYKTIESKNFMEETMAAARLTTKGHCLSILQIRSIAQLFMNEDQTLEFVKYAYDLSSEKKEYYLLEDVFKYMSTRDEFNKFLQGK